MSTAIRPIPWRVKSHERRFILFIGDALVAGIALVMGTYIWASGDAWLTFSWQFINERILNTTVANWFFLLPAFWLLLMVELYDPRRANRRDETLKGIGIAALVALGLYFLVFFALPTLPRRGVIGFIGSATLLTVGWRFTYIAVFTAPQFMRRVLIIGAGKAGCTLARVLRETWPPPFYLVGLIDDDPKKIGTVMFGYPVIASSERLLPIIEQERVSDLVLAISGEIRGETFQTILDAEEMGVEVTTMPVVYEELMGRVPIFLLEADWIIRSFVDTVHVSAFYEMTKRLIDLLGGLVGTIIMAVAFPFIALTIVLDTGFPIFFLQNRLGKRGQIYKIIKFRTMRQDAEKGQPQATSEHDPRITRAGWLLRKTHMDELPQFINVLRGEMSLVGPRAERAELVRELQNNIPFYRARLLVKPGITGWAQINFGYAASVEDTAIKLEYDLYYIKHRNLITDFVILLRTMGTVVGLRGQ